MAGETNELERLVVRLVGDGKMYEKMLKEAEQRTKVYTDKLGRLHDQATGKFVSGQLRMDAALLRTGRALKSTGMGMRNFGRTLSMRVTLPLTIMAGVATKSFATFDKAMVESTSIMGDLGDKAEEMRTKALAMSMSGEALQGPKDLAKSYFFLASAGKSAEQSIALLPAVSKFATAGAFDMALATDLLTDAQSALGLTSKNVAKDQENLIRVSDVLVKANTLANATVHQFSTALTSKAGAALKSFNKDVEEGVAVLAALADQGVKAELAGNSLGRMIRLLSKSSMDNAKQHKILGFRVFDTAGKMRNLGDIVANLEQVLRGMTDEHKVATLAALGFEARVQAVILPLLGTSKAIKKYEAQLRKAQGITDEVARKQMKAFANQMTVLKNQVTVLAIEIGEVLAPALTLIAGYVKSAVETWRTWSDTTKTVIVVVAALAAALGPLLIVLGFATTAVGHLVIIYGVLKTSTIGATVATLGLRAAMTGLVGLGIAAFFVAARVELARLRAEANKTAEAFVRMADKRLKAMPTSVREAEGRKRLADVRFAQERLRKAEALQAGSGGKSIGHDIYAALLAPGIALGFDPAESARKELAVAEEQLRKFQDFQARTKELAKTDRQVAEAAAGKGSLLAEAERQAKIAEKRERVEKQTQDVIEALEMEIRTMRTSADAVQLWAMRQDGATKAAIRFTAELQKQRNALKDQEEAQRERQQFMERGKRVMEQFRDPLETFKARRAELMEMLLGGALGEGVVGGAAGRKAFAGAMGAALKELGQSMVTERRKKVALPANIATRWGSVEGITSWKAHQREQAGIRDPQRERMLGFLERIADAVEAETGIDITLDAGALEAAGGRG